MKLRTCWVNLTSNSHRGTEDHEQKKREIQFCGYRENNIEKGKT